MAKISFVMPAKNRDKLIAESIQSIIDQTEQDWELVVVDDHSGPNDNTKEVVESFSDQRIKYFRLTDENGLGISAARNFGNQMATSNIIAVMDSDDIAYPDRAELTLKAFENGADVVYGKMHEWDPESGEVHDRQPRFEARNFNLDDFKLHDFIPHSTSAYKRQLALDFPYNSFFRVAEDYDFFSRLCTYRSKFAFIDKHLLKYRRHTNQVTKTDFSFKYSLIVCQNRDWPGDKNGS